MAEVIGCILYDNYGYNSAFMFSAGVALLSVILIMFLIPNTKTYLSTPKDIPSEMQTEKGLTSDQSRLSKFLIIPMVACMCINASYGVLQVAETPFLKEEFHKSITYGGTVLILASAGMATGSFITGILLQKKIFNAFTVMAMGALCLCLGMLITFPPEFIPAMYHEAPITAFPGLFIAGFGYPFTTLASLRVLYNIQMQKRRVLPPKVVTRITGLWLIGYCSVLYLGSFVAGVMTDYVSYSVMAGILSTCCLLAMVTCVLMRFIFRFSLEVDPDRKTTTVIANPGFDENHTVIFGIKTKQCEGPCA
ncbi:uncharacterized protein LOC134815781 [Bolinopsis microptera]|uniref:uncharacterized protein LOC134815781 n=1 Tax=Bolinopsis microptera TaxID=2820187 RepID=UPI003078E1F3